MTAPWPVRIAGLVLFVFGILLSLAATSCCIQRVLTIERTIPPSKARDAFSEGSPAVAYVLGGTEASLKKRFLLAAALYREGTVAKVLFLSRSGKTHYNQVLGRNLTNDEWTTRYLTGLGLSPNDLEPLVVPSGVFGTLSEAAKVIEITRLRGYKTLILVTSSYHTHRVWLAVTSLAAGQDVTLYIYAANDEVGTLALIWECLKLGMYKIFLVSSLRISEK